MDRLDVIFTTVFGSSLITFIVAKWLGRKKEDIEVALNYQEYYDKFIKTLKEEIAELKKESVHHLEIIEQQKINLIKWEANCEKLQMLLKEERKEYQKLLKQLK